jgi:hypothetical protein
MEGEKLQQAVRTCLSVGMLKEEVERALDALGMKPSTPGRWFGPGASVDCSFDGGILASYNVASDSDGGVGETIPSMDPVRAALPPAAPPPMLQPMAAPGAQPVGAAVAATPPIRPVTRRQSTAAMPRSSSSSNSMTMPLLIGGVLVGVGLLGIIVSASRSKPAVNTGPQDPAMEGEIRRSGPSRGGPVICGQCGGDGKIDPDDKGAERPGRGAPEGRCPFCDGKGQLK